MSRTYLKKRLEERAALADLATKTLDKCAEADREPTSQESEQLGNWADEVKKLDAEIKRLEAMVNANESFDKVLGRVSDAEEVEEQRAAVKRRNLEVTERPKSIGQQFVESDAFKNYSGRGSSGEVEFPGFLEKRAAITTSDLDIPAYQWDGPRGYVTTTPLLDVLGREVVNSGTVEYITWGTSDPTAGEVAEGEVKPEADMAPEEHSASLKTYAHWKAITRQALEDYARIQSIVEGKLRGGLADKLEKVAADTITGATLPSIVNDDILAGIRQGIGMVQAAGYQPNAVVLNPADYADLDLAAAGMTNDGPVTVPSYWGLRPVPAAAIPQGSYYVGDFTEGVTWFDRNTASVFLTDSHADYFVRNLLVVLAEQRAAFAVTEPNALAVVTATAPDLTRTVKAK